MNTIVLLISMIYFRINGDVIRINRTRSKIVPFSPRIFKCIYATEKIILCTLSRRTWVDKHFNKYTFFLLFLYQMYTWIYLCVFPRVVTTRGQVPKQLLRHMDGGSGFFPYESWKKSKNLLFFHAALIMADILRTSAYDILATAKKIFI